MPVLQLITTHRTNIIITSEKRPSLKTSKLLTVSMCAEAQFFLKTTLFNMDTHIFPIVAETLGGLGQDTIRLVRSLGKSIAQQACFQDSTSPTSQLFHRLAIALWRRNACLWIHLQQPPSVDGVNILRHAHARDCLDGV